MNTVVSPPPKTDPTEREKFDFEKEAKNVEGIRADREIVVKENELKLKERQAKSPWTNPLMVAVIGAMVVGLFNLKLSADNAREARKLSADNSAEAQKGREFQASNDTFRAENSNVVEILKMNDPEKIKNGFCLLLIAKALQTPSTIAAVQSYVDARGGCDSGLVAHTNGTVTSEWLTASANIPGCGQSGCYQPAPVCGAIPAGEHATGNVRNFGDSFSGAWGEWGAPATATAGSVCRTFIQHSHNVSRTASFQYEVTK
jgi:hypothetical protein